MLLKAVIDNIDKEVVGMRNAYTDMVARLKNRSEVGEVEKGALEMMRQGLESLEGKLALFKKLES